METVAFNPVSMLDRIKQAENFDDLSSLTREGFKYKYASKNTRSRWAKAAGTRKRELAKSDQ